MNVTHIIKTIEKKKNKIKALAAVGDFKIGGRVTIKVNFAGDKDVIAKTQEELQDMLNRLFDTGRK